MKSILYAFSFLFLISCGSGGESDPNDVTNPPDFSKLTPECFEPHQESPVIGPGNQFYEGSTWGDPTVLKVGDEFIMYASSSLYTDPDDPAGSWDQDIKIYRLISSVGTNWTLSPTTAVFEKSISGWDKKSVETPSVVFYRGMYHLFYTGYPDEFDDSFSYRIGHASSSDGISWVRETPPGTPPNTPLLSPDDPTNLTPQLTFNQWVVAEPGAVVFNDKIYLYFAATGSNLEVGTTADVIGVSIYDGDTDSWSAQKEVMRADQTIYPRTSNIKGFSTPSAAIIDDNVHLFTTVVTDVPFNHFKIHHAFSTDGETNWVQDTTDIIDKSEQLWHSNDLIGPTALLDSKTVFLWYGGNQGALNTLGIGLSSCEL